MNDKPFVLNNRFWIYPRLGLVKQKDTAKETRLEPRLMQLLCVLANHNGELVSRELLTKEVWDDYGNADEGLTQGISYLRKVLDDPSKTLIETVPKKGYVLHAVVKNEEGSEQALNPTVSNKKRAWLITTAIIFVVILTAYFLFYHSSHTTYPAKDVIGGDEPVGSLKGKNPDKLEKNQSPGNADKAPDTAWHHN